MGIFVYNYMLLIVVYLLSVKEEMHFLNLEKWGRKQWILIFLHLYKCFTSEFNMLKYVYIYIYFFAFWATPWHMEVPDQESNWSYSFRPMPQPQQCRIWAASASNTTAHGNTRSLAHWARSGIEPATSWFLVGFVSTMPWQELLLK